MDFLFEIWIFLKSKYHGRNQDQYFKNHGSTKMVVFQTLKKTQDVSIRLECYGAGKSVTPTQ